jgi:hypothetical protein
MSEDALPLPDSVNILGVRYQVQYCDNPAEVDVFHRSALWGQIDFWTRTIRIYRNGRTAQDLWWTLMHEIIHGIVSELHMKALEDNETEVDCLALALIDVFTRNGWMRVEEEAQGE